MLDDVGGGESDAAVEFVFAAVDARQHEGRGEQLEGTAQREALVLTPPIAISSSRIEHDDAETALRGSLDLGEASGDVGGRRLGARFRDMQGGDG